MCDIVKLKTFALGNTKLTAMFYIKTTKQWLFDPGYSSKEIEDFLLNKRDSSGVCFYYSWTFWSCWRSL